ncbi:MAG TPA: hypothetical protein VJ385_03935, partial [Fibrobacteria bacterium]|nr:hypothetical protein [Fibrobacteria bacterium]
GGGVFQIDVGYPIEKPIGKENEPFEASSQGSGNAVSAHARGELVGSRYKKNKKVLAFPSSDRLSYLGRQNDGQTRDRSDLT